MLITNFRSLLTEDELVNHCYICGQEKAKELFLAGFQPVSVDEHKEYIFYKSEILKNFLRKECNTVNA